MHHNLLPLSPSLPKTKGSTSTPPPKTGIPNVPFGYYSYTNLASSIKSLTYYLFFL